MDSPGSRTVSYNRTSSSDAGYASAETRHNLPWRKRRESEFKFPTTAAPGIDLAILIAAGSAIMDIISLMQPWLLGLNDEYVAGKGLTYAIAAQVSGLQLVQGEPYLAILFIPAILTGLSVILAILPQDHTVRFSYKLKSGILLIISLALSLYPSYVFMNDLAMGANLTGSLNLIVSFWEMGSGATLPTYAGLGFASALVLRIFKD